MPIRKWKKITSKIVYKNPWYQVREDTVINPLGKKCKYSIVVQKQSVFVVAVDDERLLQLIQLYRYTTGRESIEVPGGGVEKGETYLAAAKRELLEETGLKAHKWKEIGVIQLENGVSDAIGHIFLAKKLHKTMSDKKAAEGINNLNKVSFSEALEMIDSGKITDSITVASIIKATLHLGFTLNKKSEQQLF